MSDYLVFAVKDLRDYKKEDYFFEKDYLKSVGKLR